MKNLEQRLHSSEFEIRSEEGKPIIVEGYAARFDEETVIAGQFVEKVSRAAFEEADMSNTVALFNHDMNQPLARAGYGLELEVDDKGLKYRFELGNQSYAKDLAENIRMGNVATSSFGFTVKEDSWEQRDGMNVRTLEKIGLLFDVSPTTQGAYDQTEVGLRGVEVALRSMETAFANEEVRAIEEEVAAEEVEATTEVREEEAPEAAEEAVEEVTEERSEENQEEAPASEEEEEQIEAIVEEEEDEAEEVIETESDAAPAEEEETTERASQIPTEMENQVNAPAVVQSSKDTMEEVRKSYDFAKAINEAAKGNLTGLEAEMHQEARSEASALGATFTGNLSLPLAFRADAAAMTASATGTQTNEGIFDKGMDYVRNFQPAMFWKELGAEVLDATNAGRIVIPVQTANITAQGYNELADIDQTNVGFTQVPVETERIGASTQYSKDLLLHEGGDLGGFIFRDMSDRMGLAMQQKVVDVIEAGLTYVDDTAGAYSGGATATDFAELAFLMEQSLRDANVDPANAKFLLDPKNARRLRRAALDAGSGLFAANRDTILGYDYKTTTVTTADKVVLGKWNDLVVVNRGGLDIVVDPYTGAQRNTINLTMNAHIGAVVRRPDAFKAVTVSA